MEQLPAELESRLNFLADSTHLSEEELRESAPDGYGPKQMLPMPYRHEDVEAVAPLLDISVELINRVAQVREALPGSQVHDDDKALARDKPDGVGMMSAYVEQCLIDASTHCEAIHRLVTHPYAATMKPVENTPGYFGQSSAIAVHQRAIVEAASVFLWVTEPEKPRDRYLRLVKELRDELELWEEGATAERLAPVGLDDVLARISARYALDFSKAQRPAARNATTEPKKSRTQMMKATVGDEVYFAWKRMTADSHGSVFLNQFLLLPGSPFSPQRDARFRSNAVHEALRRMLARTKKILESPEDENQS